MIDKTIPLFNDKILSRVYTTCFEVERSISTLSLRAQHLLQEVDRPILTHFIPLSLVGYTPFHSVAFGALIFSVCLLDAPSHGLPEGILFPLCCFSYDIWFPDLSLSGFQPEFIQSNLSI